MTDLELRIEVTRLQRRTELSLLDELVAVTKAKGLESMPLEVMQDIRRLRASSFLGELRALRKRAGKP